MKAKPFLLVSATATLLSLTASISPQGVHADSYNVSYTNNAYQVWQVQDKVKNLFLGDSIYQASCNRIQLKNSIRLKKSSTSNLSFTFEFDNEINSFYNKGHLSVYFLNDSGSIISYIDKDITDERDIDEGLPEEYMGSIGQNSLTINVNTSSFPDYFVVAGDEYSSSNMFYMNIGDDNSNYIKRFDLYDDENIYLHTYSAPVIGKYTNNSQVYHNGSTYTYAMDYDNRLTVDDILKNIIAYDYGDDKELDKVVSDDTYSTALNNNSLGLYSFKISSTDSSSNKSTLTFLVDIEDKVAPTICGDLTKTISYTELNEDGTYDISKLVYGNDNHDGTIKVNSSIVSLTKFETNTIEVSATDSSSNTGKGTLAITVTDDVAPTIEGPSELSFYQYEIGDISDILSYYTFDDGQGSGVEVIGILEGKESYSLGKPGDYHITLSCKDKYNNSSSFGVNITIKDGIGPVFFIDEINLSLTTSSLRSADDIVAMAMNNNSICYAKYKSCQFIDENYTANYNTPGSYETKIVCYKEDGTKDYLKFNLQVSEAEEKNVLKRIWNHICSFFDNIGSFLQYIWNIFTRKF